MTGRRMGRINGPLIMSALRCEVCERESVSLASLEPIF